MKWIDMPPVWLIACLALAYWVRLPPALPPLYMTGVVVLGFAALIFLAALLEFWRAGTTIIPRESPDALIDRGMFRYSRNPIYLADVFVLTGFSLIWGSTMGLLLIPVLVVLLKRRFILGEEARLSDAFGDEYAEYRSRTRRWF